MLVVDTGWASILRSWRRRGWAISGDGTARDTGRFGFRLSGLALAAAVFALSRPALDRSRLGTIMYDTFGHHTDPAGYGSSPFGFWGQRDGIRSVLNTPFVGASGLTSPHG